jgi:hypothetical protein
MSPRRFSHLWTIVATIAGVIGAGAAVYPLVQNESYAAHLTFPSHLEEPFHVWIESLNDPIILTGQWYIKHGQWWWNSKTLREGNVVRRTELAEKIYYHTIKSVRVPGNEKRLISIDDRALATWAIQVM